MAETYDNKAILGEQLETLATDIAADIRLRTRGWNVTLSNGNALAIKWPANKYISRTSFLVLMANRNCGYDVIALGMRQNSPSGSTPGTCPAPKMQVITYSDNNVPEFWYNNTDATERAIYLKFPTMGAAHPVSVIAATNTFSEFTVGSIDGGSVTSDIATDGTSGVTYVSKGGFVDVSGYTSYNAILAVANSGRVPYYPYTDSSNSGTVNLYYAGSYGLPNVGMVLYFRSVMGNTLYHNSFPAYASTFTNVQKMPLFDADKVLGSSDASSWSGDNTNVPTRAAVEAKISSAMSGNVGGYIGNFAPQSVLTYQNRIPFKNGDWISMGSSGTAYYYPDNDDTQTLASISVNSGDCIYWTVDGDFVIKPSNAVQVFTVSSLSDWNTLTNTGLYQIASQASGVSNSPGSGQFSCLVSDANGKITQVATGGGSVFYRFKSSGQWSSWRDVKNADNYVYNGASPVSIGSQFATHWSAITSIQNYLNAETKIAVVNALPQVPDANTLYFI